MLTNRTQVLVSVRTNRTQVLFELITGQKNLVPGDPPKLPDRPEDCRAVAWGDAANEKLQSLEDAAFEDSRGKRDASSFTFLPRLGVSLAPTEDSRNLAYVHGLRAQLDALDLTRPTWYVADMPKEELTRLQAEAGEASFASAVEFREAMELVWSRCLRITAGAHGVRRVLVGGSLDERRRRRRRGLAPAPARRCRLRQPG